MSDEARFPVKLECLFTPSRYKILYGGRGGSKSWGVARALLIKGAEKPIRVLCAREVQISIQDSVHRLLVDQVSALGLESFYRVTQSSIQGANGSEFLFAGLRHQDIGKIKSLEGVDICWVEEAQSMSEKSWNVLIPTIRKDGSEIWVTFNPDLDSDPTYQRFVVSPPQDSIVLFINWQDNPWFPLTLDRERVALQTRDPEAYANVWEGKCKSVVDGAIYANEIASMHEGKRLRNVPVDPLLKVHTIFDLGWNDQTSIILAQRLASEIRIVEYVEDSHRTLAEYISDLRQRPYAWGVDWLPHDGASKNLQTGKSAQEILQQLGRRVQIVPKLDVEEGIRAARLMFPRVYFSQDKTMRLVECLKRYRRAINQNTNEPGHPVHDEFSHGADAFRYLGVIADKMSNDEQGKPLKYPKMATV